MSHAESMTSATALVKSLISHGVDTVFGLPGVQTYALFEALRQHSDRLDYIGSRHEQGAAYMALGYAKSTGRPGIYTVVPGAGFLNTSAALSCAYSANAPVLCLTSEVPTPYIGSGAGLLHELPDQLGIIRRLTKWAQRIERPEDVPARMNAAFGQLTTGRPRPVAVEVPWDVLQAKGEVTPLPPLPKYPNPPINDRAIDEAIALIRAARQPMIMVGGGAMDAGAQILELAQRIQAPIVSFRSGRGVVSDDSSYAFTCAQGYPWWQQTDLLIGIGSRLELQYLRWPANSRPPNLKIVRIEIDPTELARELGRRDKPNASILADATEGVAALNAGLARAAGFSPPSREADLAALKKKIQQDIQEIQPQIDYLRAIRDVLPRDGFFVEEISQVGFASFFGFPVYEPRTFVTCGYQGALGFGFPTALGVKAGNPERAVVSVTGDGGFMFGVQELAAAVQHNIGLVTVLFNNNAFGNVLRDQRERFGGEYGAKLVNPDFVKLAESFGAAAFRVKTPEELRRTLEKAFAARGPVLIEVPVARGSEVSQWKYLMPGGY